MRNFRFVFAIMLVIALSAPALAEIRPGAFSVSPFVGGYWFEGNQDLKHRPVYGLRLGYDFTKNWGAEAVFDYIDTKYKTTDTNTNHRICICTSRKQFGLALIGNSRQARLHWPTAAGSRTSRCRLRRSWQGGAVRRRSGSRAARVSTAARLRRQRTEDL